MNFFSFYAKFVSTFLFIKILEAELSESERANASQSLWLQFQKRNVAHSRGQPKDSRYAHNQRFSLDDILKPNAKPKFPIRLPNFGSDDSFIDHNNYKSSDLFTTLGEHNFNENFMSIQKPNMDNRHDSLYLSKTSNELQKKNRRLILRKLLKLPHMAAFKRNINGNVRRSLRKFLGLFSLCPVRYRWNDMGSRFWPRWIREGSCVNISPSCSYPEGMVCHEYQHRNIAILRFLCMANWPTEKCKWYKIYIPFLLTCKCGCNN